jgi:BirA family biotin operon repressor/biotin-[acetyl-CoA-carboxylase] ligase
MDFARSRQESAHFEYVAETGSTNTDLIGSAVSLPDFSVRVAGYQNAGRGRSGRQWLAPEGSSLFVSILLKPTGMSATKFSWLPLIAGLAMTEAVSDLIAPTKPTLKWPNDVLINERKISGILSELVPDLSGVVVGAGLNVLQTQEELPIENATSLAIENAHTLNLDEVLARYLVSFKSHYSRFVGASGDAVKSGIRFSVMDTCGTLNRKVRAILPGDSEVIGEAVGIDDSGRLILLPDGASQVMPVAAGDIVHLRHN